jgi:hypothetical protein
LFEIATRCSRTKAERKIERKRESLGFGLLFAVPSNIQNKVIVFRGEEERYSSGTVPSSVECEATAKETRKP